MEHNVKVYNDFVHEYHERHLYPPEREIVSMFRDHWHRMRVLDIGIGTGRTTYTLAAIAGEYVGIDYAGSMLERARSTLNGGEKLELHCCDARDLSGFGRGAFDLVLFSMNGLDSVAHEDRQRILREVRDVLRVGGHFVFSTHLLPGLRLYQPLPSIQMSDALRGGWRLLQALRFNTRMWLACRGLDIGELKQRNWAILKTGDHDFRIDIYHVSPAFQLTQLNQVGFHTECLLDPMGRQIDEGLLSVKAPEWLYFVCRRL